MVILQISRKWGVIFGLRLVQFDGKARKKKKFADCSSVLDSGSQKKTWNTFKVFSFFFFGGVDDFQFCHRGKKVGRFNIAGWKNSSIKVMLVRLHL